jgi:transcriptional regulator with XRE-family HTH domain
MTLHLGSREATGRMIAAARMLAGWDQATLGSEAGCSASTVSNVERGSETRDETLKSIRRALRNRGVSMSIDKTNGQILLALIFSENEDDEDDG